MSKDRSFYESVTSWTKRKHLIPLIHSNLLLELFQSRNSDDFSETWAIIENHGFSNFSPLQIIYEEINFVFDFLIVDKSKMLKNAVFFLSPAQKKKCKSEYLSNSWHLRNFNINSFGSEIFIKSAQQNFKDIKDYKLGSAIKIILNNINSNHKPDFSNLEKITNIFLNKKIKHREIAKREVNLLLDNLKTESSIDFLYEFINKLIHKYNFKPEQLSNFTIGEIVQINLYLILLHYAYEYRNDNRISLSFYIENLKSMKSNAFPGYHIIHNISEKIRDSVSNPRISDKIDFVNLAYLPYVEIYITDAIVANTVRQFDKKYHDKIYSLSEFRNMIA